MVRALTLFKRIGMANVLIFSFFRVVKATTSTQRSSAFALTTRIRHPSIARTTATTASTLPSRFVLKTTPSAANGYHYKTKGTVRYVSSDPTERGNQKKSKKKTAPKKKQKWAVNENAGDDHAAKLAAAFEDFSRKEGFDASLSHVADHATFEDEFEFLDQDEEDDDDNDNFELGKGRASFDFSSDDFDVKDFDEDQIHDNDDDEYLDFGRGRQVGVSIPAVDMDARIAAAKNDLATGRVSIPDSLNRLGSEVSFETLKKLGFKREVNPFGDDETPRKQHFKVISNANTCPACGSDFQSRDEKKPGYLPPEKYEIQMKLSKLEEMQKLKERAETFEWSAEDEIEYLIRTSGQSSTGKHAEDAADIDVDAQAKEMGLDLVELARKKVICKRCHGLQNSGKVDDSLRPGWTDEPTMSQEKFRTLLRPISEKPAVIVALIDLFDFSGSVLPELDEIAGDNPVILAANKVDLLPAEMGQHRVENWVRRELEYIGVKSLANIGGAVRLISCKTGFGVLEMLEKARNLAEEIDGDVYVVGSANAGKSTLINFIVGKNSPTKPVARVRAGNKNAFKGDLTTSPLPGTTLKFIRVDLGDGRSLYDTPGLLVPGALTQLLTPEELKIVVPKKRIEPITFRVAAGKCVLVGGLAKLEVVGDCKPFLFTFFVANEIKLHPTDSGRAEEFVQKHAGEMLTPPLEPGPERLQQIGEMESHTIDIEGGGWKEAAADISLTGLGWVAVTGAGSVTVKITVPKGVGVAVRPPLMPFDIWEAAAKYTGTRAIRKTSKSKSGKRRKGVGRN